MTSFIPSDFHFLAPVWLWLLAALPLVWGLIVWQHKGQNTAQQLVDKALLPYLLKGKKVSVVVNLSLFSGIWMLLALSLAGPAWQKYPISLTETKAPLVIAVSLSQTMNASDVPPSRISRARFKALDLLDANAAGDTALVAYAQDAFVVAPLTRDSHSLTELLQSLSPHIMPADGNRASTGIAQAQQLLEQARQSKGLIVLMTDNADDTAVEQAKAANNKGYIVSVLGIGSAKKQPITLANGELLKDAQGNLVLSHRNDALLKRLAQAGGGSYISATADNRDIAKLAQALVQSSSEQQSEIDSWQNMGPYLLLPLLLLVALLFRRGVVLLILLVPMAYSPTADAADWQQTWDNLWQRNDQQAANAIKNNQPELAEQFAKDPQWKGAGAYQAKHYDEAIKAYRSLKDATSQYNLGNALAQSGQLQEAIDAYEQSLTLEPNNADAKYNLKVVKELLEQQQQNQNGDGDDQNQDSSDKGESGDNDKQNQDSNGEQSDDNSSSSESDSPDNNEQSGQNSSQSQDSGEPDQQDSDQRQADAQPQDESDEQQNQADFSQAMDDALNEQQQNEPPQSHDLGQTTPSDDDLPDDVKQMIQLVPDDPGALLKRKFELEQQRRNQGNR